MLGFGVDGGALDFGVLRERGRMFEVLWRRE
jgi:hypothetical protein